MQHIIKKLSNLGERQLEQETEACAYIESLLKENSVSYIVQTYETFVPRYIYASLTVDGKSIEVRPCGFVSGNINSNHTLLSSLISSQRNIYDANVNFNPLCPEISRSNHYFAPSLAINRRDVEKVVLGTDIRGEMKVEKKTHTSKNLLVGNVTNPAHVVVSHYDSISFGASDNASGTALSLDLIFSNSKLLENTLFALCGNEELSYDEPLYWGHGYRVLEAEYSSILDGAQQILILDSFGYSDPVVYQDIPTMLLSFPVTSIEQFAPKMKLIAGNFNGLMEYYHADNDVPENLLPEYLHKTKVLVQNLLF